MFIQLAVGDVLRDRDDGLGAFGIEIAEIAVHFRRGALDQSERVDDLDRHLFGADAEVM